MKPDTYNQLVDQNIQKDYKKTSIEEAKKITKTEQKIAQNLDLADRIEVSSKSEAYCTLKDTKNNFRNNPKCRLINPNKGNIGIVSKQILQKLNNKIRSKLACNQWRSTNEVLKWFNEINKGQKQLFIQFDIVEFYPSISIKLLSETLD